MKHIKLKELIRKIDGNKNKQLKDLPLLGINIDKEFMPSVANTIGTDMSNYQILKREQFACNPMHLGRDERMPTALLLNQDEILVSPAYFTFEIINKDIILPEYLMLYFKQPETDRLLWFKTDSSVRGGLGWNELCDIDIPVPSLEIQKSIIRQYNQINDAIKIKEKLNNNLEEQAFLLYKRAIKNYDKNAVLSDIANITMGTSPDGETYNDLGNGIVFYQGRSDFGFRVPTVRLYTTEPKKYANKGDILMSVRAPVGDINIAKEHCAIGRGLAAICSKNQFSSFLFYTMLELKFELNKFNDEGTVFGSITKDDLFALPVINLSLKEQEVFERIAKPIDNTIFINEKNIIQLKNMQSLLLKKLTAKTDKLSFI